MSKTTSSINGLVVTYGVAVASMVMAVVLGSFAVIGAIAMFVDVTVSLPGIFGVLGGNGIVSLITTGALATAASVVTHMALKKITASSRAGELVASDEYSLINKTTKAVCYIAGGLAIVAVVAVLLGALLSISDYTPWKSYLVGQCLPLLVVAASFIASTAMVEKFTKAQIKPEMLGYIVMAIATTGLVLSCIAVMVKSHTSSSSSIKSTYRYLLED